MRATPRKLQSVADEPAKPVGRPKSRLASTLDSSHREMLVVLRAKLAKMIDECDKPAPLASLMRQFREVDAEIRGLDSNSAEDYDDDDDSASSVAFDPSAI